MSQPDETHVAARSHDSLMVHTFSGDPWGPCAFCQHEAAHPIHRVRTPVAAIVCRLGAGDVRSDVEILAHHALVEIRCDHEAKTDVAVCNCALWASEPLPSVQAAKEAWAAHALEELGRV